MKCLSLFTELRARNRWVHSSDVRALGLFALCFPLSIGYGHESARATSQPPQAISDSGGTVRVPAFELPLSVYMSTEARKSLLQQLHAQPFDLRAVPAEKIAALRKTMSAQLPPLLKHFQEQYRVNVSQTMMAGIRTHVITPKDGVAADNRDRVLINLHGGGFLFGDSGGIGLVESIPIAALGHIEVISVDYRLGPEYQFPAASEDVTSVYRELLKRFDSKSIGIYGCSAGGLLTAQAAAWIQKEHLPRPGALGIFCASADARWAGDSYFTVPALTGQVAPAPGAPPNYLSKYYYGNNDLTDPLMSPVLSPEVLSAFSPTLILTGTRAPELSAAVHTDTEMTKAGVTTELHVWDGMWHGFLMDPDLPESQEAYKVIVRFFGHHLGKASPK